jgi:predicted kinase
MNKTQFFLNFLERVQQTPQWQEMASTVEDSPWHREANVAVHTEMCIRHYLETTADLRSDRQQLMTLMTLLFHDFGKPEAEETLERKDGTGTYRRYAGHEPVSANEFLSFICAQHELRNMFFAQGFGWEDVRKIKFMIEHHLPFGMTNPTKRANLRRAVIETLGADEVCFYDQLWSDCNGRISDDHEAKKAACMEWIVQFNQVIPAMPLKEPKADAPVMYVLVGPVGVGKTTWVKQLRSLNRDSDFVVVSEDDYRLQFFRSHFPESISFGAKDEYAAAWQFCFDNSKAYDAYVASKLTEAVKSGKTIVLDRTNQTRKSRSKWINAARQHGYAVRTVEFYIDEVTMHDRQRTRPDKFVPYNRAHQIYMNFDVPQVGVEVDSFEVVFTG